jgi:hypothetical protein
MFQAHILEETETHFFFNNPFLEIRVVYDIIWKKKFI